MSFSASADAAPGAASAAARTSTTHRPVVIEVRDVEKAFRVPRHRVDSLKERVLRPMAHRDVRLLHALRSVSFDVHQGEFFGIVGRNGSGKSTLLKILASIYSADGGSVRVAGRLAPFIELGVGFNAELTARENAVLNGVMLGLSRREAQRRLDAVLEFAELEDFVEVKLKNYSSGMMVRLAFAIMVQADADIMLVDEVLAVGDAAFAQKCMDVFAERRRAGRTVVLVTHDMASVQALCDRAMLIQDGVVRYLGDAEEAAQRYYRANFARAPDTGGEDVHGVPDVHVRIVEDALRDESGTPLENIEQDQAFSMDVLLEARLDLEGPMFAVYVVTLEGTLVFGFTKALSLNDGDDDFVAAGERIRLAGPIENRLQPGRYMVQCFIARKGAAGLAMQYLRLFDFVVYGTRPGVGMLAVQDEVQAIVEGREP